MTDSLDDLFTAPDGPVLDELRAGTARDVSWCDKPFLPWGELVTMNGDGGVGKGLLSVHYAATLSRDGHNVVFAVAEDAVDTVLLPRLQASEADLAHVRVLSWRRRGTTDAMSIPDDVPALERTLVKNRVRMLVIDPLLSHITGRTNSHIDHQVKQALQPLVGLAHRTGCLVLGNGHFSKKRDMGARAAAMGSTAFTNTPRVGLAMAHDDDDVDLRVVEVIKSNLGPVRIGRQYRIELAEVPGLHDRQPLLRYAGTSLKSVDDLLYVKEQRETR